ncbi:MAG: Spo0B domain-containing protein [Bacillota bacterium]|nr:Spo0B domain-containing protein [Bacillota bacterium]
MKKKLDINKVTITVILLNVIQIATIIIIIFYEFINKKHQYTSAINGENLFLYLLVLTVFANSFLIIRYVQSMAKDNSRYSMVKESLEQVEDLNKTLRGQRHDFINHLQVVYSLIEMDEYTPAKDYIEKVFNDIQKVNKVLKTSNPAVNALLQAKILYAEKRGIIIELLIKSQLKELKIPSWEFCRILGNIIDNGIYALQQVDHNKIIQIELFENQESYGFRIENNGPMIPRDIIDKIFDAGITTKGDKGEGMGLAITKQILTEYGGSIKVSSNENVTVFEGLVPKKTGD